MTLHVVKGSSGNLLGYDIAQRLALPKIVNQVGTDKTSPHYLMSGEFEKLFGGIAKVKGKVVKLHIDPDVQPKQQPHRQIPFHVQTSDVRNNCPIRDFLEYHQENSCRPTRMQECL